MVQDKLCINEKYQQLILITPEGKLPNMVNVNLKDKNE